LALLSLPEKAFTVELSSIVQDGLHQDLSGRPLQAGDPSGVFVLGLSGFQTPNGHDRLSHGLKKINNKKETSF
jgi:hypothetical protein